MFSILVFCVPKSLNPFQTFFLYKSPSIVVITIREFPLQKNNKKTAQPGSLGNKAIY